MIILDCSATVHQYVELSLFIERFLLLNLHEWDNTHFTGVKILEPDNIDLDNVDEI